MSLLFPRSPPACLLQWFQKCLCKARCCCPAALARFSILQPTGCVVGTFGGDKRPVHPSLPQAVLTEYLPVPALRLGSAPINPKDFKATLFWNSLVVVT